MSTESNQTNTQRLIKFKTLDNNITEMNVDADIPIKDLKVLIKDKLNVAPESQRLIVMGKQLNDNKKLSDYVTQDGQVIHLLARVTDQSQSQSQPQQQQTPNTNQTQFTNQTTSANQSRTDPLGLSGLLGNYANNPGMVQMTSMIFDQNGNNLTNSANGAQGNLGSLDFNSILQNLGLGLNAPNNANIGSSQTNQNQTSNTGVSNTNVNTNSANNTTSQAQPSPYPILDDTNRHIGNLANLNNTLNGNLANNEIPNIPSLNYPVNILTTFGSTLKKYHDNLQRLLPYVNQLSELLQRESLITDLNERQNANRLAKNLLTGIRDITGANKMIETFLAGLEFGNRPAGGMVTFIQGSINQIQLVGEALDNANNTNPVSFNINILNNPNNPNNTNNSNNNALNTTNANTTNNIETVNTSENTTSTNIPSSYPNQDLNSNATESTANTSQNVNTTNNTTENKPIEQSNQNASTTQTNQTTNSNNSRPAAGGINNLLGTLMGSLGNQTAPNQAAGNRQANPMGNIGALLNNVMSNPETSSIMNNVMSSLSRPGAQNNLAGMFGSLMGGMNAGTNQGGQPDFGSLLSNLMGNLGGGEDDDVEDFEMNPEIKKLCENKNNWKKTKLSDLKTTLDMINNPQFKDLVEIFLEMTIEEFHLLKRLQFDGFVKQTKKIRELIQNYLQTTNKTIEELKQHLVDLLSENFILVENDEHKIKSEGFDLERYSASFISEIIDSFLNTNLYEQELNDKLNKKVVEFLGVVFNELKKVYTTERNGALFYFAENLKEFIEKNFGDESIDNLLEINENVFEELVANGVDIYEQIQKYENIKKKTTENVNNDANEEIKEFEIKDMDHILEIAEQDGKRFEKKNINFSDEYKKTSLFKN